MFGQRRKGIEVSIERHIETDRKRLIQRETERDNGDRKRRREKAKEAERETETKRNNGDRKRQRGRERN